jgi:valyl-tRNA synthetase
MQIFLKENAQSIQALTRASHLEFVSTIQKDWVTIVSGSMTVGLNLVGTVDSEKEQAKILKELKETEGYITVLKEKMKNEEFMAKAPLKVREEMDRKYAEANSKLDALKEQAKKFK